MSVGLLFSKLRMEREVILRRAKAVTVRNLTLTAPLETTTVVYRESLTGNGTWSVARSSDNRMKSIGVNNSISCCVYRLVGSTTALVPDMISLVPKLLLTLQKGSLSVPRKVLPLTVRFFISH